MTKAKTRILTAGLTVIALIAALFVIPRVWTRAGAEDVWDGTSTAEFAGS